MDILALIALLVLVYYNYMLGVWRVNKLGWLCLGLWFFVLSCLVNEMWLYAIINLTSAVFITYRVIQRPP